MTPPFTVRVTVRAYELDTQGHLNGAVYHQYGDHARWECLRAAGISVDELIATGVGPVTLENTIRYHRELHAGDDVDITCAFDWGEGKTFRMRQELRRTDGALAAEITSLGGLLDLKERRLVPDPGSHWRALAETPALLGL
ncbi:acyl-CoA thioesterase [Spirillospora sp. CA-142024]|uniref:acyl-CoA thioesterase n=1 Tax=unclassified Spirillospora TaxID=2642701 RepID=UPI003D8B58EE